MASTKELIYFIKKLKNKTRPTVMSLFEKKNWLIHPEFYIKLLKITKIVNIILKNVC